MMFRTGMISVLVKIMIKLSKYIRMLLESKMTLSLANKIFSDLGYPNASNMPKEKLRAAWADLSIHHHPDKGGNVETMQNINSAYDLLKSTSISSFGDMDKHDQENDELETWQTDDRAMRDSNPKKPDINYYKKTAWILSGKPEPSDKNKYTFWNWDGYYLRGVFTVYTTPAYWYEVSNLMVEWDKHYRSKAVFVSDPKVNNIVYLVNKHGKKVDPPQPIEHESFNANPGNDWSFINRMRKEI